MYEFDVAMCALVQTSFVISTAHTNVTDCGGDTKGTRQ